MGGWWAAVHSAALRSMLVSLLLQPQARAPHTSARGQIWDRAPHGIGEVTVCMERAEQASEEGTLDSWDYSEHWLCAQG